MNRRRILFVLFVLFAIGCVVIMPPTRAADATAGVHDFDFLAGAWRVHHRRLHPTRNEWLEFDGTSSNRPLIGGAANLEEQALDAPTGAYRALALRAFDPKRGQWAIWWLDGRYPAGPLDPPVVGGFENGVGTFYSDYTQDGKPMRGRFVWSEITPNSARWEQASSADNGKTWAPNWIMTFQRETHPRASASASASAPAAATAARSDASHDFDFLVGDWQVRHHFLRIAGDKREWIDVDGTLSHRLVLGGSANIEEHTMRTSTGIGVQHAIGLRSYDAKTSQWSIWWLDGRAPHDNLDPPVRGRFEHGVGTFYGTTTLNGKPMRQRFIWSQITPTSARWEQAYSADEGKTWEPNWIMEFHRTSSK